MLEAGTNLLQAYNQLTATAILMGIGWVVTIIIGIFIYFSGRTKTQQSRNDGIRAEAQKATDTALANSLEIMTRLAENSHTDTVNFMGVLDGMRQQHDKTQDEWLKYVREQTDVLTMLKNHLQENILQIDGVDVNLKAITQTVADAEKHITDHTEHQIKSVLELLERLTLQVSALVTSASDTALQERLNEISLIRQELAVIKEQVLAIQTQRKPDTLPLPTMPPPDPLTEHGSGNGIPKA